MLGQTLGSSYIPSGLPEAFSAFPEQDCTDSLVVLGSQSGSCSWERQDHTVDQASI